jgi:hypothetical protein
MLAFLVTRLTRMGVRLEPSRSNRPLMKAAADIWECGRYKGEGTRIRDRGALRFKDLCFLGHDT